jgi:hypothetical protein
MINTRKTLVTQPDGKTPLGRLSIYLEGLGKIMINLMMPASGPRDESQELRNTINKWWPHNPDFLQAYIFSPQPWYEAWRSLRFSGCLSRRQDSFEQITGHRKAFTIKGNASNIHAQIGIRIRDSRVWLCSPTVTRIGALKQQ